MTYKPMSSEQLENGKRYREMGLHDDEYARIKQLLGRRPNIEETGIFSAMWSEHCSYKTSKPLLKQFPSEGPHVLQGPGEGAGVIDVGDNQAVVFKMESHNSPSYVEPFEGAATGVGGIVRDVFSMGAKPIALLNSLRFGELTSDRSKHLASEVVRGIAHYGNNLEVPTLGGEMQFDACYEKNPLVNAMCVGILSHEDMQKGVASGTGNTVIYAGRDTGKDGIGGASFSSEVVEDAASNASKVALGDPFVKKRLIDACLEVVASDALIGMQDMGAAGLTSSASEMASASGKGMDIDLNAIPQREKGMNAYELLLSESQERMLLVVEKGREQEIIDTFTKHDINAVAIGHVTDEEHFRIFHHDACVANIPIQYLVEDAPVYDMPSQQPAAMEKEKAALPHVDDYADLLRRVLTHPTVASKTSFYEQYDSDVQGNTLVAPGEADAGVVALSESKSLAVTTDGNSRYIKLDPKTGGQIAVAEAARNIVCTGAKPLAITDGLNYGDPTDPEVFWEMEQSINGISEAARMLGTPVVSGNVSLYNESSGEAIFPSPIVGMVGLHDSRAHITTSRFKQAGDAIYCLGGLPSSAKAHFGGSILQTMMPHVHDKEAPAIDLQKEKTVQNTLLRAIEQDLVQSAHDVSEGGLAVALAESVMNTNGLGIDIALTGEAMTQLFSEAQTRIVISVKQADRAAIEHLFPGAHAIGEVTDTGQFHVQHNKTTLIREDVATLENWWNGAIQHIMES